MKKTPDFRPDENLTAEADAFAAAAVSEFNSKQAELRGNWGFETYRSWEFSPETSLLRLKFRDALYVEARCGFFATYDTVDKTLEWCWNNPRYPKKMVEASHTTRKFGEKLGLRYLTEGMIPVPTDIALPDSYQSSSELRSPPGKRLGPMSWARQRRDQALDGPPNLRLMRIGTNQESPSHGVSNSADHPCGQAAANSLSAATS